MIACVARVPRRALTRRVVGLWAHVRRRRLDAALAAGADPWSAADLMLRASRLGSFAERREIAAALEELLAHAEQDRAVSPRLRIRRGVVLEQRDTLLELAARLRDPAPVSVAVVATLAWLARDESSPVYIVGRPRRAWPTPQLVAAAPSEAIANVSEKPFAPASGACRNVSPETALGGDQVTRFEEAATDPPARPGLLQRYLPIFAWLPNYERTWLKGDAVAGLSVWALLVPQSLAYATLAGFQCSTGSTRRSPPCSPIRSSAPRSTSRRGRAPPSAPSPPR